MPGPEAGSRARSETQTQMSVGGAPGPSERRAHNPRAGARARVQQEVGRGARQGADEIQDAARRHGRPNEGNEERY